MERQCFELLTRVGEEMVSDQSFLANDLSAAPEADHKRRVQRSHTRAGVAVDGQWKGRYAFLRFQAYQSIEGVSGLLSRG